MEKKENLYFIVPLGDEIAEHELRNDFSELGLTYSEPDLGGIGEFADVVTVALVSLTTVAAKDVAVALLADGVKGVIEKAAKWVQRRRKAYSEVEHRLDIYLYHPSDGFIQRIEVVLPTNEDPPRVIIEIGERP
ncbi:hypothetical protein [Glutamicibacter sp. NPDC087344]|uniref:hypothetical protein n=1 Tax=Glutamicibacter sp. NPDC087344 TaxID=3363994 RepID=UPI00380EC8B5